MNSSSQPARLRPFRPQPFGRYTLLSHLATGGMGEIYLARLEGAQGFEKLCVIKKILPQLAADSDFVERFVGEARTLVRLSHGSIAQVLDMGLHEDEAYMALEHVDGKDLRKVAARVRDRQVPLPVTFVLYTMGRVLDALAYAHRKKDDDGEDLKLVHRDISPQNILISYEGEVKVIDFGLAKSRLSAAKTNPSIILGKFLYMSPEQARHQPVDRRSDLYAVGLCLYELICGKNPFDGVHPGELMSMVAHPRIAPLDQVEPLTPPAVTALVTKALAVDPAQRFQTAEEFRGRLQACLMEIDASAGPESVSRFMRELFSADFQSERRLLASLREVPRLSTDEVRALASMPDDPLAPKMAHAMLPPKTIRLDGPVEPLSFFPTPRSRDGGGPVSDGETRPGVPIDESTRPAFPIEAIEEEARARGVRQDTEPSVEVEPEAYTRGSVEPAPAPLPRAPALTREVQMTAMPPEAVPPGVAAARALLPPHMRPTELAMPSLGEMPPGAAAGRAESTEPRAEPTREAASEAGALKGAPTPSVPPRGPAAANARPAPAGGAEQQAGGAVLPRTGVMVMPAVSVPADVGASSAPRRTASPVSMPAVGLHDDAPSGGAYAQDETGGEDDESLAEEAAAGPREASFQGELEEGAPSVEVAPWHADVEETSAPESPAMASGAPAFSGAMPLPRTVSTVMPAVASSPPPQRATPSRAMSAVASPLPPSEDTLSRATPAVPSQAEAGAAHIESASASMVPWDASPEPVGAEGAAPLLDSTPENGSQRLSPEDETADHPEEPAEMPVFSTEDVGQEDSPANIADMDTHPRIHRPSRSEHYGDTQPRVAQYGDTDPRFSRHEDTQPRVVLDAGFLRDAESSVDDSEERSGVSRPRPQARRGRASSPGMATVGGSRRSGSVSAVRPAPAPVETEVEEDEDEEAQVVLPANPNEETRRTTMPVRPESRSAERIAKEETRRTARPAPPARRRGPLLIALALLFLLLAVGGVVFLGPAELRAQVMGLFVARAPQGPPPSEPIRPTVPPASLAAKGPDADGSNPEARAALAADAEAPAPDGAAPVGGDGLDDSVLAPLDTPQGQGAAVKRAPAVRKVRTARPRALTTLEQEWRETNALFIKLNAEHSCVVLGLWCTRYAEVKSEVEAAGANEDEEALRKVREMRRYLQQKQKELY